MNFHRYIVGSLWLGALLLVVLLVSLSLWLGLTALGDRPGGRLFAAIAVVAAVCWTLDFITLVVLLALAQLATEQRSKEEEVESDE